MTTEREIAEKLRLLGQSRNSVGGEVVTVHRDIFNEAASLLETVAAERDALLADNRMKDELLTAAVDDYNRAVLTEREACARLVEEGFDRAVAESYRNDGVSSKNDKCQHGRYMYEDCEACCVIAIRSSSGSKP